MDITENEEHLSELPLTSNQPDTKETLTNEPLVPNNETDSDPEFSAFYNEINEQYELDKEGISKEMLQSAYDFYTERYGDEISKEDKIEAIRLDVFSGQMYNYESTRKRVNQEMGTEALEEFDTNMRKLESIEVLASMGNEEQSVSKLNAAFAESTHDFAEVLTDYTHFNESYLSYSNESSYNNGEQEQNEMSRDMVLARLKRLALRLETDFAKNIAAFKELSAVEIRQRLQQAIDMLETGSVTGKLPPTVHALARA